MQFRVRLRTSPSPAKRFQDAIAFGRFSRKVPIQDCGALNGMRLTGRNVLCNDDRIVVVGSELAGQSPTRCVAWLALIDSYHARIREDSDPCENKSTDHDQSPTGPAPVHRTCTLVHTIHKEGGPHEV